MAVQYAHKSIQMKTVQEDWHQEYRKEIEQAKAHPAMFIGWLETAHRNVISEALGLIRKAHAFRSPKSTTVHLSPTKYIVRSETGCLLPAIEELHSWGGKHLLTEGWHQVHVRLCDERVNRIFGGKRDFVGWKRYFAGATGPTLDRPIMPAILARRFAFAYKTASGFWGQTFEDGWPHDDPFLLQQPSAVGLLIMAELNPLWFPGLPYTPEDALKLSALTNVSAIWYNEDADLDVKAKSATDICHRL